MSTWYASALPVPAFTAARKTIANLINWRVVVLAGGTTFLLIAGTVSAILLADYRAHAVHWKSNSQAGQSVADRHVPPAVATAAQNATAGTDSQGNQPAPAPAFVYVPWPPAAEQPATSQVGLPESERIIGDATAAFENFGTQLSFAPSPSEAVRQALKERKLLFTLHLAGNFEECKFT